MFEKNTVGLELAKNVFQEHGLGGRDYPQSLHRRKNVKHSVSIGLAALNCAVRRPRKALLTNKMDDRIGSGFGKDFSNKVPIYNIPKKVQEIAPCDLAHVKRTSKDPLEKPSIPQTSYQPDKISRME